MVVVPLDCIQFARVAAWSARQLVGACHIREYLGGVCILGGDFVLYVVYDCVEFLPSAAVLCRGLLHLLGVAYSSLAEVDSLLYALENSL